MSEVRKALQKATQKKPLSILALRNLTGLSENAVIDALFDLSLSGDLVQAPSTVDGFNFAYYVPPRRKENT